MKFSKVQLIYRRKRTQPRNPQLPKVVGRAFSSASGQHGRVTCSRSVAALLGALRGRRFYRRGGEIRRRRWRGGGRGASCRCSPSSRSGWSSVSLPLARSPFSASAVALLARALAGSRSSVACTGAGGRGIFEQTGWGWFPFSVLSLDERLL
jgi:hypothetical protein